MCASLIIPKSILKRLSPCGAAAFFDPISLIRELERLQRKKFPADFADESADFIPCFCGSCVLSFFNTKLTRSIKEHGMLAEITLLDNF